MELLPAKIKALVCVVASNLLCGEAWAADKR